LRLDELIKFEKHSAHRQFDFESKAGWRLQRQMDYAPRADVEVQTVNDFYKVRRASDEWNSARWALMNSRFDQGKHLDTYADF